MNTCARTKRVRASPQSLVTCTTCVRWEISKQPTSEQRQVSRGRLKHNRIRADTIRLQIKRTMLQLNLVQRVGLIRFNKEIDGN